MGVTNGAGTGYLSGTPDFTPSFSGVRVARSLVSKLFLSFCLVVSIRRLALQHAVFQFFPIVLLLSFSSSFSYSTLFIYRKLFELDLTSEDQWYLTGYIFIQLTPS